MAISPKISPFLLMLLIIIMSIATKAGAGIVSDLHSLRSRSPSGVIHLNETLLEHIFNSNERSFYVIIFFDAILLHDKPEPNLKSIRSEFALISNSFILNNQNNSTLSKVFFFDIEFGESENGFQRFGIQALPNIRIVPPDVEDLNSASIPMDVGEYSCLAESMADFIESKTRLSIGRIHHPPMLLKMQLRVVIVGFLIWVPFMINKVIAGGTIIHNKKVWIFGTIFVYFFSVSGSMFIFIHRIPLFVIDRKDPNKAVFFFKGNGMQFCLEGMCIGFLFTIVGLLLAFLTRVVLTIKESMMQRLAMINAMIVSFWAVKEVVRLDHWKTGKPDPTPIKPIRVALLKKKKVGSILEAAG